MALRRIRGRRYHAREIRRRRDHGNQHSLDADDWSMKFADLAYVVGAWGSRDLTESSVRVKVAEFLSILRDRFPDWFSTWTKSSSPLVRFMGRPLSPED